MRQETLAVQTGFEKYARKTKRGRFLGGMEQIVPWAEVQALVEPHYPKGVNGRAPVGWSIMLRGDGSGDASEAQGEAVVLRTEGAHRSGLQGRPCAFGMHVGGLGGGQAHVAGSAARGGAQGVGRRWVSGTGRSHPAGGSASARYDQPESAIQELCGRVTKGEEPG